MNKTDLIIIGAGPGGYRAALYAVQNGLGVVIAEKKHAGGTCLNEGCIPTKCFAHDAELFRNPLLSQVPVDFLRIQERKQGIVEQLRQGVETLMQTPGITFLHGEARFISARVVDINGEKYTAQNIIIATGSYARQLPVEGRESPQVLTSTEMLSLHQVPHRLCIIGAGVIGMEFASAFQTFGSKVTVIEFLKECLPAVDSEIAKRLRKSLSKRGVQFYLQSSVKAIKENRVIFEMKGKEEEICTDTVLVATGRGANSSGLNLEKAGVLYDRKGIAVNDNMETNVKGIYAIGDVNGKIMLAHAAVFEGFRAVNHILHKSDHIRLDIVPSAIFTYPEAASVGLTEDTCKRRGIDYICKKGYYHANCKAVVMEETEGLLKLVIAEDGTILGCHVCGAHAADIVQEVVALMNRDTTLEELKDIIHIHPTLGEILQDAVL